MRIARESLIASLPAPWPHDVSLQLRVLLQESGRVVVVLDDDPTGTQTVHDTVVLTRWTPDSLADEIRQTANGKFPLFYLLTNSRSMPPADAARLGREIGQQLQEAAQQTGNDVAVISRSDSTLRGHFPAEVAALAEGLARDFAAWLLIPAFFAGERYTIDDVHYVADGPWLVPAAETESAHDATFGYRQSNLRAWVEERTGGRVRAEEVSTISLDDIRSGGWEQVRRRLLDLPPQAICAVNAVCPRDLEVAAVGLLAAEATGVRYLVRSAASFVAARCGVPPRELLTRDELHLSPATGGLVVAGSYVPRTTAQLAQLRTLPGLDWLELSVAALLDGRCEAEIARAVERMNQSLAAGEDVVVSTSRQLITRPDAIANLAIGQQVSQALVAVVQRLAVRPRYILAKGGITSSDLATAGLGVRRALVTGQIAAGIPVWQLGPETPFPGLAYLVFPGNVGSPDAMADIVRLLRPS